MTLEGPFQPTLFYDSMLGCLLRTIPMLTVGHEKTRGAPWQWCRNSNLFCKSNVMDEHAWRMLQLNPVWAGKSCFRVRLACVFQGSFSKGATKCVLTWSCWWKEEVRQRQGAALETPVKSAKWVDMFAFFLTQFTMGTVRCAVTIKIC